MTEAPVTAFVDFQNGLVLKEHQKLLNFSIEPKSRKLSAESPRMKYVGKARASSVRLAIVEKKTGKVQLVETVHYSMMPEVLCKDVGLDSSSSKRDDKDMTFVQKLDRVSRAFGTKRKARAVESRLRNKLGAAEVQEAISGVVQDVQQHTPYDALAEAATAALRQQKDAEDAILPQHRLGAERPEDVYDFDAVAPSNKLSLLHSDAQQFMAELPRETITAWDTEEKFGKFLLSRLPYLPRKPEERKAYASRLLLIQHLTTLFKARATELRKKDAFSSIPKLIREWLLKHYTMLEGGTGRTQSRVLPPRLKERLLADICLLALHVSDFILQLNILQADLGVSANKLTTLLRSLGCAVSSKKLTSASGASSLLYTAQLKLPLTFPSKSRGPPKRK